VTRYGFFLAAKEYEPASLVSQAAMAGRPGFEARVDLAKFHRMPPIGVVAPRTADAAVVAITTCSGFAAPVLSRGGGASLAGQCGNEAVVADVIPLAYHPEKGTS
jgi:FAD/FMN-containing dehydrogenase